MSGGLLWITTNGTPNGRFKTDFRLCLSMSDYHPDTWYSWVNQEPRMVRGNNPHGAAELYARRDRDDWQHRHSHRRQATIRRQIAVLEQRPKTVLRRVS